jgi:hypothetical protein
VLGDELLQRRRLASADLLDYVVRAGKDTVLVTDGIPQMLGEEALLCATSSSSSLADAGQDDTEPRNANAH